MTATAKAVGLDSSRFTAYIGTMVIGRRVIPAAIVVIAALALGSCGGSATGSQSAAKPSAPAYRLDVALVGGAPSFALKGTPSCYLGSLSPGSPHPNLEVDLSDPTTLTKLMMAVPDIVAGTTYSAPSLRGDLQDPSWSNPVVQRFLQATPPPQGNVVTSTLSKGSVTLLAVQGRSGSGMHLSFSNVSGKFDLTFTLTVTPLAACVFCRPPQPVQIVATASGTFNCSPAAR